MSIRILDRAPLALVPRRRGAFAALLLATVLAAGLSLLPPVRGDAPADLPDPVPLKRVWLAAPDRLAQEMDRARQGVLVKLPRDEFEDLVRRAALAESARKGPPRLVEAHYHAELADNALVGSCQWKVVHTAAAPGLLPLSPLNLALREPRFENGDALIADFDGHDPSLLVETPGDHSASVGWSARGEARPEGLQFDLRFPASPAAVLELDLPADRTVLADGGGLSGPHPSGTPNLDRWTIACGGRSQVSLVVRAADQAPVVRAGQQTTQVLTPSGLEATFAFTLQALHQGARELVFDCDPELRPYDVTAPGLEKWEVVAPAPDGSAPHVVVRLADPLEEGTVQIHCLAPLAPVAGGSNPVTWTSPGMRLRRCVPGGETLTLKVHPDLRLAALRPGGFRLRETGVEAQPDGQAALQRLTFVGGGVTEAGAPTETAGPRPQAVLYPHGVEFRARQLAWWRVDPTRSSLTLQIAYDVSYGRLFRMAVRLPSGWEVGRVDLAPAGLLRNWSVGRANGAPALLVDLQRPLAPAEKATPRGATLTVNLEPAHADNILGREVPFPDAAALGARFREGALAVGFDGQAYRLEVKTTAADAPPEDDGPWGKEIPAFFYPYREQAADGGPAPAGSVTLASRPPQVRAQCVSEVILSAGQPVVDTRLLLEAEQGSPESVDLYLSAPCAPSASGDPWGWQGGVAVRSAQRLHGTESAAALGALGATDPFSAAAFSAARPDGECWRLTFARPLRVHEPAPLHARITPKADGDTLNIPLTTVLGAGLLEGEVTLDLAGPSPPRVEASGLREASPAASRPRGAAPWRTFRYTGAAVDLTLHGPLQGPGRVAEGAIDRAVLTTCVGGDGRLVYRYAFQASHWPQPTLPLTLPPDARLSAFAVDGLWSPRPALAKDDAGRPVLELPVPRRPSREAGEPHRYEVIYTAAAEPGWLWTRVEAAAPAPPVAPAAFQRLWRLAPELSPLDDAGLRRRPGPGEGTAAAAGPFQPDDLFRAVPSPSWFQARNAASARDALPDALLGLRGDAEQHTSLGDVAARAAAALQKAHQSLTVDAAALAEAGVDPSAALTVPPQSSADETAPWDALGLAAAATPSGPLLTTARQLREWRETTGAAAPPAAVEAAAAEAVRWGRDSSGRFRAAAVWPGSLEEDKSPLPYAQNALAQWTEWEPLPGGDAGAALVVVRRRFFDAAGWTLAALLGLLLLGLARGWKQGRLWLLLLWLGASGLGLLWLPAALQGLAWPPLLGGCACALVWRLASAWRQPPGKPSLKSRSTAVAAGTAALLLLVGLSRGGPAEPAGPTTVYLVPGPADAPDRLSVLAPPDLLDQLHALARPGGGPGAVLLNAEYDGQVVEGQAEFEAVFQAYCLTDEPTTLALPLDGVQLTGDVLLDGAPVQATALPAPQAGFTLPLNGRPKAGEPPHKVELHFRTPVVGTPEERDVQFTGPRLAQSRLTMHVPRGSAFLQTLAKYGLQKVSPEGDYLEAELGRISAPVHVRWLPESWAKRQGEVQYREAYLWDLRPEAASLTAFLSYNVARGSIPSLAVKVPQELEVVAVEARRPADGGPLRLRDWQVRGAGADRALQMTFAAPITGDLEVLLELAPRAPLPPSFILPLPVPQGRPIRDKGAYLAYRTRGLEVERVNPLGVTGIRPEEFAPFWPASSRPDPRTLAYASTILREDDSHPPVLGLKVRPAPPAAHARLDMEVRVGPRQADVRATAVLTAPDGDPPLVQWEVQSPQPFTVTGVTGPKVRRWNQEGDRVLAWLDPAAKGEATLELTGWLPLATAGDGPRLELPCLRVASAGAQDTTVRLIPGDQLVLTDHGVRNLAPADKRTGNELSYSAGGRTDYGGAWGVHGGPGAARVYTVAGRHDRRLAFAAVVEYQPAQGDVQALTVRVRNWAGDVRLEAPATVRQHERRRAADDREWTLEQEAGVPGRLRVVLYGEQSAGAAGAAAMPDVSVPGAARVERWAAAGAGLTAEAGAGLAPAEGPAGLDLSGEVRKLSKESGLVWKITSPEWRLNLSLADAAAPAASVEVYLAEYRAAAAGGRWLHEAAYWLRHEANTDLNLTFPADAEVLSLAVDGAETAALQPEPKRLWLPLTGRPAVCRVRVRWRYAAEDLAHPELGRPQVQGAQEGPAVWTVEAPPGWEPDRPTDCVVLRPGLAQAAAVCWQQAEAQYRLSDALAPQAGAEADSALADAQRRFYAACVRAKRLLDAAPAQEAPAWPAGRAPLAALEDLLQKNRDLAEKRGFEAVRKKAEEEAKTAGPDRDPDDSAPWQEEGRPLYARAAAGDPAPTLTLAPAAAGRAEATRRRSWGWLGVLGLVGLLAMWPSAGARLRVFWPEQIGLVALAGWWAAGATAVVLVLLALAVGGRVLETARGVGRLFRRPAPVPSKSTASMPAAPEAGGPAEG